MKNYTSSELTIPWLDLKIVINEFVTFPCNFTVQKSSIGLQESSAEKIS